MAQQGSIWKKGNSWFLRYRKNVEIDGVMVRKLECVKLAEVCDRYRCKSDLEKLVKEKMDKVSAASECSNPGQMFTDYIEKIYLPHVQEEKKASTYAGRKAYYERYIKPGLAKHALVDLTKPMIFDLLKDVARTRKVSMSTLAKIRSILYGMLNYAVCTGAYRGDNPADDVILPKAAIQPEPTEAATREEVQALLKALKGEPLARAAVGILAYTGVRPGEARGLRWEEWDRVEKQIHVCRSIWHRVASTPKTQKSVRFVAVTDELREILLDLWNARGCPISGFVLAGRKKDWPVILDNLTKRVIRPAAEKAGIAWKECYALRRFHGTEVRERSNGETMADALGNTKDVARKHYLKPSSVLPDVRRAVNDAFSGLVQ
jgi:integrase